MNIVLCADLGSTFTKLTAVDVAAGKILGSARAFTSAATNVVDGFEAALAELRANCGPLRFDARLAVSSAAGGLKMVAIGLVPELTVQAARLAAANAGAKILKTFAFELSSGEIDEILALDPDIILLSGGTDGGNKDVIIRNAGLIAASGLRCPLVVAGNKSAESSLKNVLRVYPGETRFVPNVMPEINKPSIEAARKAIGELFVKNIIFAKGLAALQQGLDAPIIPTPLSVFLAAELLSRGTKTRPGLGELLVIDVGGATTDVYSMAEGLPGRAGVFRRGLPQPFAGRTVEGDLGLRYSLPSLAEATDLDALAVKLRCGRDDLEAWFERCRLNPGLVPEPGSAQQDMDEAMTASAVSIAVGRHCGVLETVYGPHGPGFVQTGKDLSAVTRVVGTGGPIVNSADPARVLQGAVYAPEDLNLLKPLSPECIADRSYMLSAMGSLSRFAPEAALSIMLEELAP